MWARRPWDREAWGGVRRAADSVLEAAKVRDEASTDQFERMNQKQRDEMKKYQGHVEGPVQDYKSVP
jgi:hypothetical protein